MTILKLLADAFHEGGWGMWPILFLLGLTAYIVIERAVFLRKAGIEDKHLTFFHIHMECDDDHAFTLQQVMLSCAGKEGWYDICLRALTHSLHLRDRFFDAIFDAIQHHRVQPIIDRIQARQSLALTQSAKLHHRCAEAGTPLYSNEVERLNVRFSVDRLPFPAEVLDPRIVRIPPGKYNEKHRHAHETVFYVIQGRGKVLIDDDALEVVAGDAVFAPRWALHQTQNTGESEMVLLAVTDFGLTGKAFVGSYHATARLKRASDGDADADAESPA
jgi:quercetin dioxygenase-like cupin family protein